jgi:hypothetical protein
MACSIPNPKFYGWSVNGLRDDIKKVIVDLLRTDDDFLYYFGGIKRGNRLPTQSTQPQQQSQKGREGFMKMLSKAATAIEQGIEKAPSIIKRIDNSLGSLGNLVGIPNIDDILTAINIFVQKITELKKNYAKHAESVLNTECMRNPIAFLIVKIRKSVQYKNYAEKLQQSINSMGTNPALYEQQLNAFIGYIGSSINKIFSPLCNIGILGSFSQGLARSAMDFFSAKDNVVSNISGKTLYNTGKCKSIDDINTKLAKGNPYYDNLQFGGGGKKNNNNATKKAKKRAALIAKVKANVRNPNKPPRPVYEEPAVTQKQKAVYNKFKKNVQNKTKKQNKQKTSK